MATSRAQHACVEAIDTNASTREYCLCNKQTELPERGFEMTGRQKNLSADITPQQLAQIGEGHIAYLKLMKSEDICKAFPGAPDLAPGLKLFALLGADGAPLVLADTKAAALANAWEQDLHTVSLH